jgi:protein-S-isoprenylcysteine O-methyltransferase Ste14
MLYFPLHPFIMVLVDRAVGVGGIWKKMGDIPFSKSEERFFIGSMILIGAILIYSIFLPLKVGSLYLYVGLPIFCIGLMMLVGAIGNIATTPPGGPFDGLFYRCSRHPMTVAANVMHVGVGIATASWIVLGFALAYASMWQMLVPAEERGCLETYGESYRQYLNRTPKWVGFPKSN